MKMTNNLSRSAFSLLTVFVSLLFSASTFAPPQEAVRVSGKVSDQSGLSVIGAAVVEKGNPSNGVITDLDGNYSIEVSSDAVLQFSSIGYSDFETPVNGRAVIDVVLEESSEALDEAVLVGYGTVTKRSVSTAMATVDADKIAEMPTSNLAQSLVGLSSGLSLQQIDGTPGAAPAIRIRGAGSINSGNDPLYVIDGYPTTDSELFNNLNPADIEDIQIMKDAASSAIYGSKAGNGVIMITTRHGSSGKPKVSFSAQVGVSQAQKYVDVLGASDYLDMIIEARQNSGTIANYQNLIDLRESGNYLDTNWQDAIFRNALNARGTVSLSGGTDKIRYNLLGRPPGRGRYSAEFILQEDFHKGRFRRRYHGLAHFRGQLLSHMEQAARPEADRRQHRRCVRRDCGSFDGSAYSACIPAQWRLHPDFAALCRLWSQQPVEEPCGQPS